MAFKKQVGLEARYQSMHDLNRGHETEMLDHPFAYPAIDAQPERVKRHPAGLSLILGGRGPVEWLEKLPSRFDSSHRFVPPPVAPKPQPAHIGLIGDREQAQRPSPVGSTHRLRVMENWKGVSFGGKKTFFGVD